MKGRFAYLLTSISVSAIFQIKNETAVHEMIRVDFGGKIT